MEKKINLQRRIVEDFVSGVSAVDDSASVLPEDNAGQPDMHISPELAADFEHGLESEIGDSCGCGCGNSCSGGSLENAAGSCSGCHKHHHG